MIFGKGPGKEEGVGETHTFLLLYLREETKGIHFYTLMTMRRGLLDGSVFARLHGDIAQAHRYRHTARQIEHRLPTFWSSSDNYIKVTQDQVQGLPKPSGLDISILIAANLAASLDDGKRKTTTRKNETHPFVLFNDS